jgi:hypothetical protein
MFSSADQMWMPKFSRWNLCMQFLEDCCGDRCRAGKTLVRPDDDGQALNRC